MRRLLPFLNSLLLVTPQQQPLCTPLALDFSSPPTQLYFPPKSNSFVESIPSILESVPFQILTNENLFTGQRMLSERLPRFYGGVVKVSLRVTDIAEQGSGTATLDADKEFSCVDWL
jgi:hypothetical protein